MTSPTSLPHAQDGEWLPGTGKPELFFTFGDEEKLRNRAMFFIRASDKVDLEKVRPPCPDALQPAAAAPPTPQRADAHSRSRNYCFPHCRRRMVPS
jgi:hypothetical protein